VNASTIEKLILTAKEFPVLLRLAFCLMFLSVGSRAVAIDFTEDSLATVKKNIDQKKAVLVDVRSKDEWDKGHVEGAIFLPITKLEQLEPDKLAKVLPKRKILYTHCAVGMRAEAAGEILAEHGYEVRVLQPGYDKLIKAGFKKAERKSADENPR
jgi:phage shock protein E